ncbi:potassium-transporting ATPase subunit C [Anaerostipes sp. 992a]|uniref:potassium-transporting ATPase subunit KdpC n=1 Tax=Anaerostipes sp. 992a TaxID=1261637 RepID=UPI0009525F35|nr:potassium-transporting ATPase subunit KdpC [Anaerostipes sp. 992a]MDD5969816.1 potassium-transporting ATPase subunit KdpC [Anaerostipes sp.]OLR62824.1 potassium-transporting ATPase subunit C [Anaerostipes sp. 992a]
MKKENGILIKAVTMVLAMTLICGVLYTAVVTGLAQIFFSKKANGSVIEVNGKKYGCELLAQEFTGDEYMWGRVMNVSAFTDQNGNTKMYSGPSNLSPKSQDYKELVEQRVKRIQAANPDAKSDQIPEDLVTCSGSGLDPDISIAAARYQIPRLAKENGMTENEIEKIIDKCTTHKILGIFGEETVNVLKVNLILQGVLS